MPARSSQTSEKPIRRKKASSSESYTGLSQAEATKRLRERPQYKPPATSRSYASIISGNIFTVFNAILLAFGVLTLTFGDWRDALFIAILVINSGIGIGQEIRAKRSLDRLSALVSPVAQVRRDGKIRELSIGEVVEGDIVRVQSGDQVIADGKLVQTKGLRVDESILTGESTPIERGEGDEIRSGSFAVEGVGLYEVDAVGPNSYAERIASEARVYQRLRSPLEREFNKLLLVLVAIMLPLAAILGYSLSVRDTSLSDAVTTATAAVVSLIPEGLIVLMSLTFAVGALRMARRGALAQRMNVIESLASVDVVCFDKTGTLTSAGLKVTELIAAKKADKEEIEQWLGRYAASSAIRNATLEAIADEFSGEEDKPTAEIPFSSRDRWSAIEFEDESYFLGAPELFDLGDLESNLTEERKTGRRVVAFAKANKSLEESGVAKEEEGDLDDGESTKRKSGKSKDKVRRPPDDVQVLALIILTEPLRSDARETIEYFHQQNIGLMVISGDHPDTVAAIAKEAGMDMSEPALDGSQLPEDPEELKELVIKTKVIGRISPDGKRAVVDALKESGKYVAMVGDGVNDVPALKAARLAIAQGSGVQMAKSVSDIVLVNGDFNSVPHMVREGRKILRNLQRVAKLYVAKSSFAGFLILTIGTTAQAYPLLPRHFSLAAAFTIGIPTFFLALAPSHGPWAINNMLRNLAAFAIPAGVAAGVGVVSSYQFAHSALDLSLVESRTVAITALIAVGLFLILALEGVAYRRGKLILLMCLSLAVGYILVLIIPFAREFFEVVLPSFAVFATGLSGAAIAIAGLLVSGFPPGPGSMFEGSSGSHIEGYRPHVEEDGSHDEEDKSHIEGDKSHDEKDKSD